MCNRPLAPHSLPHKNNKSQSQTACFLFCTSSAVCDLGRSLNFAGESCGRKIPEVSFNAEGDLSHRCAHTKGANHGAGKRITVLLLSSLNLLRTYRNTKATRPPVFSRLDKNDCWHQEPVSVWNMKHVSQWWDRRASQPHACRQDFRKSHICLSGYYEPRDMLSFFLSFFK